MVAIARDDIEKNLGKSIISNENALNYQYVDENLKTENKTLDTHKNI